MHRSLTPLACLLLLGVSPPSGGNDTAEGLFERIAQQAESRSQRPYVDPGPPSLPMALRQLSYPDYRDIRFEKENALWRSEARFHVEFFHPGFVHDRTVRINEVKGDAIRRIPYDPDWFDFGRNTDLPEALNERVSFAGFRVHYPLNNADYKDEFAVFLGASYFRLVGRGQRYGLSARGLAIDTGLPSGEEFPRFEEFWLVKPAPDATSLTVYALLNSRSVTGAYRFRLHPEQPVTVHVRARLFARRSVTKLGLAPLTSMFMWGENSVRHFDDYRPEVHDSDGLLVHDASGEWIWRPLANPRRVRISSLTSQDPKGFGLAQRDRRFDNYLDTWSQYHRRPSLWVTPEGDSWGAGAVQLVEIPSDSEANDNIVAFWVPRERFEKGDSLQLRYRLETFGDDRVPPGLATVKRTRTGRAGLPGSEDDTAGNRRQFIVDFEGGPHAGVTSARRIDAELTARGGRVEHVAVERLPGESGWRAAFKVRTNRSAEAVDLRLHLTRRGQRISETWNYVWDTKGVQ